MTTTTAPGIDEEAGRPTGDTLSVTREMWRGEPLIRVDIEAHDHLPQYSRTIFVRPGAFAALPEVHAAVIVEREACAAMVLDARPHGLRDASLEALADRIRARK